MKEQSLIFLTMFFLCQLSGCSGLNEGAIDYRYIEAINNNNVVADNFDTRYFSPSKLPTNVEPI